MKNIDVFDAYAAEVFAMLYDAFPVCEDIDTPQLCRRTETTTGDGDKDCQIAAATLHWLRENGFISMHSPNARTFTTAKEAIPDYRFTCVVLTAKGLSVLKQTPESLKSRASLGEAIGEALKEGLRAKAGELVGMALGQMIKLG